MTDTPSSAAPPPLAGGAALVAGIDVGTTFTGAAVVRAGHQAEAVPLGRQRTVMPTAVWLGADGGVQVGEAATRRLGTEPERVARLFKGHVGTDRPFSIGGLEVQVERLLAEVIESALATVTAQFGSEPSRVALTFPASWGPYRQGILVDGARQCGVEHPLLVTEPEAAAAFYATQRDVADGSLVAVFDFGGGTLDIAVVHKVPGGFELLGTPRGDDQLGGSSIDALVLDHVTDHLRALGVDRSVLDDQARASLERECVEAKEALSFDEYADIPVVLPGGHQMVRLERPTFDGLIGPVVERSHQVLLDALAAADVAPSELTAVLLVGGTSRIPLIAETLDQRFGCEVAVNADPKTSVCLGAAQLAANPPSGPVGGGPGPAVDLGIPGLADPVLIGSGGYSVVYKARQIAFDRDVAVKVVTGGGFDLTARRQFERECRTIGQLSEHPNIVTVYDSGVPADRPPYLVMAHLARGSLQDRLSAGGAYPWDEALDVTLKVGDALDQAHEAGIVHCDVKPANILVSARGEPQLADFGLARVAERTGTQSIMGLVGTPHYSPPELFDGAVPAPTRDIYSLAATAHALMSGQPPIGAGSTNVLSLMRQVVSDPPVDLRPLGVPAGIAAVIEGALDKDPARRPQTMAEFLDALRGAAPQGSALVPPAPPALTPSPATPGTSAPVTPPPTTPPPTTPPVTHPTPAGPAAAPPPVDATMELRSALPFDEASGDLPPAAPLGVPSEPSGDAGPPMASGEVPSAPRQPVDAPSDSGPQRPQVIDARAAEPGRSRLPLVVGTGALALAVVAGGSYAVVSQGDDTATTAAPPTTGTDPTASTAATATTTGGASPATTAVTNEPAPVVLTGFDEVASFDVGAGPWTSSAGREVLWVPIEGGLVAIDLASSEVVTIPIEGWSETPLVTEEAVWVPNTAEPTLTRVDPDDLSADPVTIPVGQRGFTPVLAGDAVWVPNRTDNTISRVDIETNESVLVDLGFAGVGLAEVGGEVWVSTAGGLFALDADGAESRVSDFIPSGAAVAAGGFGWVVEAASGNVARIDPATKRVTLIDVGGGASSLTPGPDAIWFIAESGVHRLDLETGTVTVGPTVEGPALQLSPILGGSWLTSRAEVPMLYLLNDDAEIVDQRQLDGVPDAPTVVDGRMFLSLIREGARVLEFQLLTE